MKEIQSKLLSAFDSSKLTYDELAKRTKLPKSALHRYLNGDTAKIPIDRLCLICRELDIDAAELLGWKSPVSIRSLPIKSGEQVLLEGFRSLSSRGQQLLLERCEELKLLYGKKLESNATKSV